MLLPIEFYQAVLVTIPLALAESSALVMLFFDFGEISLQFTPSCGNYELPMPNTM